VIPTSSKRLMCDMAASSKADLVVLLRGLCRRSILDIPTAADRADMPGMTHVVRIGRIRIRADTEVCAVVSAAVANLGSGRFETPAIPNLMSRLTSSTLEVLLSSRA